MKIWQTDKQRNIEKKDTIYGQTDRILTVIAVILITVQLYINETARFV